MNWLGVGAAVAGGAIGFVSGGWIESFIDKMTGQFQVTVNGINVLKLVIGAVIALCGFGLFKSKGGDAHYLWAGISGFLMGVGAKMAFGALGVDPLAEIGVNIGA